MVQLFLMSFLPGLCTKSTYKCIWHTRVWRKGRWHPSNTAAQGQCTNMGLSTGSRRLC